MRICLFILFVCYSIPARSDAFGTQRWPESLPEPQVSQDTIQPKMMGGSPSTEKKVVAIFYRSGNDMYVCSGLLISKDFVLTAAHCACEGSDYRVTNDETANNGATWRAASVESLLSKSFCKTHQAHGNDLALLRLRIPLAAETICDSYSLVPNIPLAGQWLTESAVAFRVAGYGYDGDIRGSAGKRREATLPVSSFYCLNPVYEGLGCSRFREFVLGGSLSNPQQKDSCGGDSGGPVFLKSNEKFLPIGIVSRGLAIPQPSPELGKCGAGGIYTHLGRKDVIDWLSRSIPPGDESCRRGN